MKRVGKVFLFILTCALIVVSATYSTLLQSFHIPSGAMIPTLLIGDNLLVSKIAYWGAKPKRGDVAVFRSDAEPTMYFIMRVIGLPEDRVQMKEGVLYINDMPCPVESKGELQTVNNDGTLLKAPQYVETLPNGLKHPIIKQVPFGAGHYDNTPVYTVPAGHYFMMGDNRDGSNDSRVQDTIGYIPSQNFVGKASFIYFSTGGLIALWEFLKWPSTAHYSRIFQGIH